MIILISDYHNFYQYGGTTYYYGPHFGGCRDWGSWGDNGTTSDGLFYFSEKWWSSDGYLPAFGSLKLTLVLNCTNIVAAGEPHIE